MQDRTTLPRAQVMEEASVDGEVASSPIGPAFHSRDPSPMTGWQALGKRGLDLVLSAVLLVVLSPLLLAIAAAIRLDSRGPALFRQERLGAGSRPFTVLKFRTMREGAPDGLHRAHVARQIRDVGPGLASDSSGNGTYKLLADPRVTRLGLFLRRSSLDELPQLINVVRGEMSLVGPRPPLAYEVAGYEAWQLERLLVRPGITGLWQVSGRSTLSYRRMCELDVEYVRRWSLWLDLKILLRTVPVVLLNRGQAA